METVQFGDTRILCKLDFLGGKTGSAWRDGFAARRLAAIDPAKISTLFVHSNFELALAVAAANSSSASKRFKIVAILAEDALNEERLSLLKALKVDIVRTPSHNAQNPESLNSPESVGKKLAEETRNSMVLEICSGSGSDDLVSEAMREMVAGIVGEIDASSITHIVFPDDSPSSSATPQLLFQKFLAEKLGQSCQLVSSQLAVSDHHGADHHQNDINFVSKKQAHQTTRDVISSSGILCGLRSGAAITVARRLVEADPSLAGGKIICILDDPASHYQSTLLNEDWLLEREIDIGEMASSAAKYRGASVEDLQLPEVVSVLTTDLISSAYQTMISREFSQVPVVNVSRQIVGFVAKEDVEMLLQKKSIDFNKDTVEQHCLLFKNLKNKHPFKLITPWTLLADLDKFFDQHSWAFITDESGKFPMAIVTKWDLLKFLHRRS